MDLGAIFVVLATLIVLVVFYVVFPRLREIRNESELVCAECGKRFIYKWRPGGGIPTLLGLGRYRFLRCANCGRRSWFDVWSAQV